MHQQAEFTHCKVFCALKRLPSKYSRTPDGFPAGFLKSIVLCHCLSIIQAFYYVYGLCVYTSGSETDNRLPIFKKGSQKLPSNYRPVSLTSVGCKVMESIVMIQ